MTQFGKREGGGRRRSEREDLPLIAVFTTRTRSHDAVLVDLSRTGARLKGNDLPGRGEDLILRIEGLSAFGTAKWSRLGFCGVEFEDVLSQPQIVMLERRVAKARGLSPDLFAAEDDWTSGIAR